MRRRKQKGHRIRLNWNGIVSKKSFIILICFLGLVCLVICCYKWFIADVQATEKSFITDNAPEITSFGNQKQYISIAIDQEARKEGRWRISMSQNYIVSVSYVFAEGRGSDKLKLEDGEEINITTYDLNTSDYSQRTFDLATILRERGIDQQVVNVFAITYQGKDYLKIRAKTISDSTEDYWYSINDGELSKAELIDYQSAYSSGNDGLSNSDAMTRLSRSYNLLLRRYSLNFDFSKLRNIEQLNISADLPKIAKNLSEVGAVFVRPELSSEETWFKNVTYWFAPKGQDIMEFYVTDKTTGEKTRIKSYADYEAWAKAHPASVV